MSKAIKSLSRFVKKIEDSTKEVVSRKQMQELGEFAVDLVVKRTRLGYGVDRQFGTKQKLLGLSDGYKNFRRTFKDLSSSTSPGKSNLTLTGQMLESVKVIKAENGRVYFGPTGSRTNSRLTNLQVAEYQERRGRTFNRLSQLEYQQMLRFYRKTFGDLFRRRGLLN